MRRSLSVIICVCFVLSGIRPIHADTLFLPTPGTRVEVSPAYTPSLLKGLKVHPKEPFRFDFVIDSGSTNSSDDQSAIASVATNAAKAEYTKLLKYFLAGLTTPGADQWVNLSPYEKDRIVPDEFGLTEMGRDLLAQDYVLKQVTASMIYPEDAVGKIFWKRVYAEAAKKFGSSNVPVNTFNKVWIVPEKAVVYENPVNGTAFIVESRLKVMLEEDYLAAGKNAQPEGRNSVGLNIVREIVLPQLNKEVNEGKNFAQLRQVYSSLILATWYKKKLKESILSQVYADKNKVNGVTTDDPAQKQKIYDMYLQAFKKGAFNYIKDPDPTDLGSGGTGNGVPRKYFSGGARFGALTDQAMSVTKTLDLNALPPAHYINAGVTFNWIGKQGVITSEDRAVVAMPSPNLNFSMERKEAAAQVRGFFEGLVPNDASRVAFQKIYSSPEYPDLVLELIAHFRHLVGMRAFLIILSKLVNANERATYLNRLYHAAVFEQEGYTVRAINPKIKQNDADILEPHLIVEKNGRISFVEVRSIESKDLTEGNDHGRFQMAAKLMPRPGHGPLTKVDRYRAYKKLVETRDQTIRVVDSWDTLAAQIVQQSIQKTMPAVLFSVGIDDAIDKKRDVQESAEEIIRRGTSGLSVDVLFRPLLSERIPLHFNQLFRRKAAMNAVLKSSREHFIPKVLMDKLDLIDMRDDFSDSTVEAAAGFIRVPGILSVMSAILVPVNEKNRATVLRSVSKLLHARALQDEGHEILAFNTQLPMARRLDGVNIDIISRKDGEIYFTQSENVYELPPLQDIIKTANKVLFPILDKSRVAKFQFWHEDMQTALAENIKHALQSRFQADVLEQIQDQIKNKTFHVIFSVGINNEDKDPRRAAIKSEIRKAAIKLNEAGLPLDLRFHPSVTSLSADWFSTATPERGTRSAAASPMILGRGGPSTVTVDIVGTDQRVEMSQRRAEAYAKILKAIGGSRRLNDQLNHAIVQKYVSDTTVEMLARFIQVPGAKDLLARLAVQEGEQAYSMVLGAANEMYQAVLLEQKGYKINAFGAKIRNKKKVTLLEVDIMAEKEEDGVLKDFLFETKTTSANNLEADQMVNFILGTRSNRFDTYKSVVQVLNDAGQNVFILEDVGERMGPELAGRFIKLLRSNPLHIQFSIGIKASLDGQEDDIALAIARQALMRGFTSDITFVPAFRDTTHIDDFDSAMTGVSALNMLHTSAVQAPGGIDLNADKLPLQIRSNGEGIQFLQDPDLLARMRDAKGFVPVIINLQSLTDIASFLGLPAPSVPAQ